MVKMTALRVGPGKARQGFTLIELLTVIGIIAILAGIVLGAWPAVRQKALRSRASSEIMAMSSGLEGYKTDNGIYPASTGITGPPAPGTYTVYDPISANAAVYQTASGLLYQGLTGQTAYNTSPAAGAKSYMTFKISQIGSPTANSYIKDPWGNAYGYSTGDANVPQVKYPFNGTGFFDLWTTDGLTTAAGVSTWTTNWQ